MEDLPVPSNGRARHWLRVLRPLAWWLLLVLGLFGYRKHLEFLETTRLTFTAAMEGRTDDYNISAQLDGARVLSGARLSLGRHTFTVTHPKADPFTTNLSIWYGGQDLGKIVLARTKGMLRVQSSPPAVRLIIVGPEFNTTLTNSSGLTVSVPTDRYHIEAEYLHWRERREITVVAGGGAADCQLNPPLGAANLSSSHAGATFQLFRTDGGRIMQDDQFPSLISELPAGSYRVIAEHNGNRREQMVSIKARATNVTHIEFVYGKALVETEPAGARVTSSDGRNWGVTPLTLSELQPGTWEFTLRRQGYEPVEASFNIVADETRAFRTNLVNSSYLGAIRAAHLYLAAGDHAKALEAATEAVRIQPNDSDGVSMQREATGNLHLARAKTMGQRGDYAAAAAELESALIFIPENAEAKGLSMAYAKRREDLAEEAEVKRQAALVEQERLERYNRAQNYFEQWMKSVPNSQLFDQFTVRVKGSVADVEARLVSALTNGQPAFKLLASDHPKQELFSVRLNMDMGTAGWRRCDLVGSQSSDGEVTLVFKVFEYAYVEAFSIRAWIKDNDEKNMVPIHASRVDQAKTYLLQRRAEGIRVVKDRIREAVGH